MLNLKVGDIVVDDLIGEGRVVNVSLNNAFYPYEVEFNRGSDTYTLDGRLLNGGPVRLIKKNVTSFKLGSIVQRKSNQLKGEVICIQEEKNFMIVEFSLRGQSTQEVFDLDGKSLTTSQEVCLVEDFKDGELVWVTNTSIWNARFFSHEEDGKFMCYLSQEKGGPVISWERISKFDKIPF